MITRTYKISNKKKINSKLLENENQKPVSKIFNELSEQTFDELMVELWNLIHNEGYHDEIKVKMDVKVVEDDSRLVNVEYIGTIKYQIDEIDDVENKEDDENPQSFEMWYMGTDSNKKDE